MAIIHLTQGKSTIVDDADYEWLSQWKWHCQKGGYAARVENRRIIMMHRMLIFPPPGYVTDHIDGNGLNNQRSNLRIATRQQNAINRRSIVGSSSQYRGVYWETQRNRWRARIQSNGYEMSLGSYTNELDAARAYDAAAREIHGEFARLNLKTDGAADAGTPAERRA